MMMTPLVDSLGRAGAEEAGSLRVDLNWYRCTRHTFASHWVMDGRRIEKLNEILGHSTVQEVSEIIPREDGGTGRRARLRTRPRGARGDKR
jgi:integrase